MDYIPVFLAHGFYKNRTEFKARHVVYKPYTKFPAVDYYRETGRLLRLRQEVLVHMPYERPTVRKTVAIPVEHDEALMRTVMKDRWNPWKNQPIRNAVELFSLMRRVVNSHLSRKEALLNVLRKHYRVIVFYNFDYELEILRTIKLVPTAEWNGHKHEPIPDSIEWLYFVQYTAGAEGWECITTNTTFFWSQNPSYKVMEQAYGRIDRLNTPFRQLFYYVPMSSTWIDKRLRAAYESKRDFNMAEIAEL